MQLSSEQIDQMKHCIGLHRRKPYRRHGKLFYKPYRNYFDCGRHDDPDWSEFADCGYAVDYYGKGRYELTKAGLEVLSSATGIHIYDDIAAFVPTLPKRLYVIGPDIIDSAGDEAVFVEAAVKLEGVDHLVRIPKDLVVENIDEPTAIRKGNSRAHQPLGLLRRDSPSSRLGIVRRSEAHGQSGQGLQHDLQDSGRVAK